MESAKQIASDGLTIAAEAMKMVEVAGVEPALRVRQDLDAAVYWKTVGEVYAQLDSQIGGAQRPDKARQLNRDAVLGPAGSQAGGFPALGGGGRGVGVGSKNCGRRVEKVAGGPGPVPGPASGHALPAPEGLR